MVHQLPLKDFPIMNNMWSDDRSKMLEQNVKALITRRSNCYWLFLLWFLQEKKIEQRLHEESCLYKTMIGQMCTFTNGWTLFCFLVKCIILVFRNVLTIGIHIATYSKKNMNHIYLIRLVLNRPGFQSQKYGGRPMPSLLNTRGNQKYLSNFLKVQKASQWYSDYRSDECNSIYIQLYFYSRANKNVSHHAEVHLITRSQVIRCGKVYVFIVCFNQKFSGHNKIWGGIKIGVIAWLSSHALFNVCLSGHALFACSNLIQKTDRLFSMD